MGIFDKLINILVPADKEEEGKSQGAENGNQGINITEPPVPSDGITNQLIRDMIVRQFYTHLLRESVGKRMLYPMSFTMLMHPDDFEDRLPYIQFILEEIVDGFYKIIHEKTEVFSNNTPVCRKWYFDFVSFEGMPPGVEDEEFIVEKNNPVVMAQLAPKGAEGPTMSVEKNVKVSLSCKNSELKFNNAINFEALGQANILDKGKFEYPFDASLGGRVETGNSNYDHPSPRIAPTTGSSTGSTTGNTPRPPRHPQDIGYAKIQYQADGQRVTYHMTSTYITISGNDEKRSGNSIFKLPVDGIINDHVMIRYLPASGTFELAANGPTRLNGRNIELSDNDKVRWMALANNSSIFINETVRVTFLINK